MLEIFITYFLALCCGYLIRDTVKVLKISRIIDEDKLELEKIKSNLPPDKKEYSKEDFENLKSLYKLEGHADVIERMTGLF